MRNNSIDLIRFIAAFSIITLHVGFYNELSQIFGEVIRLSGRWAVPFFFLVTGGFIATQGKADSCYKQSIKVLHIFIVSSIMFMPYYLLRNGFNFNFLNLFFSGTHFHLWFLSSMALGLVLFYLVNKYFTSLLIPLSIAIIITYSICDIVIYTESPFIDRFWHPASRHFTSLSFIAIGYYLVSKDLVYRIPKKPIIISLILFLYITEPFITNLLTGSEVMQRQFPLLTPLVSIIIFSLCFNIKTNESFISSSGREYSLGIYLLHPFFLPIIYKILAHFEMSSSSLSLILIFLVTWAFLFLLKKLYPLGFNILYGNLKVSYSR